MVQLLKRYDVLSAGKALKAVLDNPDDLPQVFRLIEALAGQSARTLRTGFLGTEGGRRLLLEEPDIVPTLADRAGLRAMPKGSVAHAYLAFVEQENITAEGLVAAAAEGEQGGDDDEYRWVRSRMRDTHDLWHTVTGYQGDVLGELSLLGFNLGQFWHPGIALVIAGGLARGFAGQDGWLIVDGFVRGKRAAWLPSQDWAALLPKPLAEVRLQLGLGAPPQYVPLRTKDLRDQGLLARAG